MTHTHLWVLPSITSQPGRTMWWQMIRPASHPSFPFVRKKHPPSVPPLQVHYSAGVGKTGTFIVLDALLQRMKEEGTIDIQVYVNQIWTNWMKMIQTEVSQMVSIFWLSEFKGNITYAWYAHFCYYSCSMCTFMKWCLSILCVETLHLLSWMLAFTCISWTK